LGYAGKVAAHGVLAGLALLLTYFTVVSLAESYTHAVEGFLSVSYLMIPLIAGFGVQVSLFSYTRHYVKRVSEGSASVTASGGLSTASMVACCIHHLTDLLPLIGLSAAVALLTAYQTVFLALGLLSNLVGITTMLAVMQKHHMYDPKGSFTGIMRTDMRKVRNLALVASLMALVSLGWAASAGLVPSETLGAREVITLPGKVSDANGLVVEVVPLPFSFGKEVGFRIKMDTHSGDLSFDLTKVAYMTDSAGSTYLPRGWDGSATGGHHREGTLSFPPLSGRPTSIRLVLKGIYGVDRTFEWNLTG